MPPAPCAVFEPAERELRAAPMPAERMLMGMIRAELAVAEGQLDRARALIDEVLKAEGYPDRLSPLVHAPLERAARLALQAGQIGQGERDKAIHVRARRGEGVRAALRHGSTQRAYRTRAIDARTVAARERTHDEARTAFERAATLTAAAAGQDHPVAQDARARLAALTPVSTSR